MTSKTPLNATDIAKLAGVSRSTVSKVINNYPDIPDATKKHVLDIIEKYDYQPNLTGQLLKGKSQPAICLYLYAYDLDVDCMELSGLTSPYVAGIISAFIKTAKDMEYKLYVELIEFWENEETIKREIRKTFNTNRISGAAFVGIPDDCTYIDDLILEGFNIAFIDKEPLGAGKAILTDEVSAIEDAIQRLNKQGFDKLCFVGGLDDKRSAKLRLSTFKNHYSRVIKGPFLEVTGELAAKEISKLSTENRPNGYIFASDQIAHGFLGYANKNDISLIESVGLIGFDNSPLNKVYCKTMSSYGHNFLALAKATLCSLINDVEPNSPISLRFVE